MTSLLITEPGYSGSNSLCTTVEASAYMASVVFLPGLADAWEALSDTEQEWLLYMAALAMNNMNWTGWKCYTNQAMCFPRWKEDETEWDEDHVVFPDDMKKAQTYIAMDVIWRGIQGRTAADSAAVSDAIKSLSLFGDISISFDTKTEASLRDGISLTGLLRSGHPETYFLLSPWVKEIGFIGTWGRYNSDELRGDPELLDEVVYPTV